jgi:site-specific DNA-adenine methylase
MNSFISWEGSKRSEMKQLTEYLKIINKDTIIIEPFCGGCNMSNALYRSHPNNKYILNDSISILINFLKDIQKNGFSKYMDYLNSIIPIKTKEEYVELTKDRNTNTLHFFTYRKLYNYIPGLYPSLERQGVKKKSSHLYKNIMQFFENSDIELLNEDYEDIIIKYSNNKDVLLLLDPPYFRSDNTSYEMSTSDKITRKIKDNTQMFIRFVQLFKEAKCKILMILNNNAIVRYLYSDFIKGRYSKTYNRGCKKITEHLIITNY